MWSRGEEREPRQAVSLDRHSTSAPERQRYFIDGPARLTSALQLISSAIGASAASAAANAPPAAPHPPSPAPPPNHPHPHGALVLTAVSRSRSEERVTPASVLSAAIAAESEADFDNEDSLEEAPTSIAYGSSPPSPGPRTIVASDGEVSNGFVKDGQRLPYVFEASDSGKSRSAATDRSLFFDYETSSLTFAFTMQGLERGPPRSFRSAGCAASASSASPP